MSFGHKAIYSKYQTMKSSLKSDHALVPHLEKGISLPAKKGE